MMCYTSLESSLKDDSDDLLQDYIQITIGDCPTRYFNTNATITIRYPCPELALVPVAMYRDPFRKGRNKIVLCELQYPDGKPLEINSRMPCRELMEKVKEEEPWLGFEQEFCFIDENGVPYDWELAKNDTEYDACGYFFMGKHTNIQREIMEIHMKACMYAGLKMYGMIREAGPSQWEYQLAPLPAVEAGDQLIVSRYILLRIVEMYDLEATFYNPECFRVSKHRTNLHTNFSTKNMRDDGGIKFRYIEDESRMILRTFLRKKSLFIYQALETIAGHNQENIMKYYDLKEGNDYKWRLSGEQYMPKYDKLVIKVGDKSDTTLRIPTQVAQEGKGYFEERRPSGEANPYEVARALISVALFKTNDF